MQHGLQPFELARDLFVALADTHFFKYHLTAHRPELVPDKFAREPFENPNIYVFNQMCSNTSCGWGGIAGQAFTAYCAITIAYPAVGAAIVYVTGRAAYICAMDEAFNAKIAASNMPEWNHIERTDLDIIWKYEDKRKK